MSTTHHWTVTHSTSSTDSRFSSGLLSGVRRSGYPWHGAGTTIIPGSAPEILPVEEGVDPVGSVDGEQCHGHAVEQGLGEE